MNIHTLMFQIKRTQKKCKSIKIKASKSNPLKSIVEPKISAMPVEYIFVFPFDMRHTQGECKATDNEISFFHVLIY